MAIGAVGVGSGREPRALGKSLGAGAVGELRSSAPDDGLGRLRGRLEEDGYVLLRGFHAREDVLAARHELLYRLSEAGILDSQYDPEDAMPSAAAGHQVLNEIAVKSPLLGGLLFGGTTMGFYQGLFGEKALHFDFTWLRGYPPGSGTGPHMDSVFMNRGSMRVMTAWTPLGDIDGALGGLAVLEGSHQLASLRAGYGARDVDTYCSNEGGADEARMKDGLLWDGTLSTDPVGLSSELGGRWLTADFEAGDLLTFPLFTVHIGLDNQTERLRLSSDTRYQPASEPADPRWVGPSPSAHGALSKRGVVC